MERSSPPAATLLAVLVLATAAACGSTSAGPDAAGAPDATDVPDVPAALFQPASGSVSGYYPVVIRTSSLGIAPAAVTRATFGGIRAYGLAVEAGGDLRVIVQGHPDGGPVTVVLTTPGGNVVLEDPFVYVAPSDPRLARMMGFGASLSQGIQVTVPTDHGTLQGPVALVARQVGAYLPLPVPVHGLFPEEVPGDVGPPPVCALPDALQTLLSAVGDVADRLLDPDTGMYTYAMGRVDPDLAPRNVAVGNCSVDEVLHGVKAENLGGAFLGHLVYEPQAEVLAQIETTQFDHLLAGNPTLVISTDFFANDVLWGIVLGDVIDPANARPEAEILAGIAEVVDTLAALGSEVFLASLPGTSLLPVTAEKRRVSIEAGVTDVDERIAALDALTDRANAALAAAAAGHANVHIVDLHGWAARIATDGIAVGDQVLRPAKFGGLVGLDGIHFTDTGYAVVANVFLQAINAAWGTSFPQVDVATVLANDPESPAVLAAAGLDACR
jgi:lysophospholipase L1-like esterase